MNAWTLSSTRPSATNAAAASDTKTGLRQQVQMLREHLKFPADTPLREVVERANAVYRLPNEGRIVAQLVRLMDEIEADKLRSMEMLEGSHRSEAGGEQDEEEEPFEASSQHRKGIKGLVRCQAQGGVAGGRGVAWRAMARDVLSSVCGDILWQARRRCEISDAESHVAVAVTAICIKYAARPTRQPHRRGINATQAAANDENTKDRADNALQ